MSLDDTDLAIIRELQKNGRSSNREVGRVLGVSEGTVRLRLKKLEAAKLMRLGLVTDSQSLGATASAFVRIKARPREAKRVAEKIAAMPTSSFVGITIGRFDIIALVVTGSRDKLGQSLEQIGALTGVTLMEVREPRGYAKHRWDLVHIP